MIHYSIATEKDVAAIQHVAEETWPVCYAEIISPAQIRYMLDNMYAADKIRASILNTNECFLIATLNDVVVGFAGIEYHSPSNEFTRLHKLYVLPELHGKQIGQGLLKEVEKLARANQTLKIHLNVNKYNPAYNFYLKHHFHILEDVVLDIGHGFVMDDYVLVKNL